MKTSMKTQGVSYSPAPVKRTVRPDFVQVMTSFDPGLIVPVAYVPLMREDRVTRAVYDLKFDMMETVEKLRNAVHVTARATFVPFLALDRFEGSIDLFNASYKGVPFKEGDDVVPFFRSDSQIVRNNDIADAMGLKIRGRYGNGPTQANTMVVECYNVLVNDRYARISDKLGEDAKRSELDPSLAPCPWHDSAFKHVVPTYDAAAIDGHVPLTGDRRVDIYSTSRVEGGGSIAAYGPGIPAADHNTTSGDGYDSDGDGIREWQDVYGVLRSEGIGLNVADLNAVTRMKTWAKIRSFFSQNLTDDHIIDLLMEGNRVPTQMWDKPQVLAHAHTIFGYDQRFATDSGNLEKSVTRGVTGLRLAFNMPATMTGGIVMITVEAVPDQLHEEKKDHFLFMTNPAQFPNAYEDDLDPHKVAIVRNDQVDISHSDPEGTFGYAPLNHEWMRRGVYVGGKYRRPDDVSPIRPDALDQLGQDRAQLWTNEVLDPALDQDFYLAGAVHKKVFAFFDQDAFEVQINGAASIVGNTLFGGPVAEAEGDYDQIMQDFIENMEGRAVSPETSRASPDMLTEG